jgi:hypothetical protein
LSVNGQKVSKTLVYDRYQINSIFVLDKFQSGRIASNLTIT